MRTRQHPSKAVALGLALVLVTVLAATAPAQADECVNPANEGCGVPVVVPPRLAQTGTTGLIRTTITIDQGFMPSAEVSNFVSSALLGSEFIDDDFETQACTNEWGARAVNRTVYVRGSYIRHDGASWERTKGCANYVINLHASMAVQDADPDASGDKFRDVRWPLQSGTCAARDTNNTRAQTCDSPNLSATSGETWIVGFGGTYKPNGFSQWNISGEIDMEVVT